MSGEQIDRAFFAVSGELYDAITNELRHSTADRRSRAFKRYNYCGEHGRSSFLVDCPFCDMKGLRVYAWSLAGSGKKCPKCGAIFTQFGAHPKKEGAK